MKITFALGIIGISSFLMLSNGATNNQVAKSGTLQKEPVVVTDKDAYVVVDKNGHFSVNGKRVRFWATTGGFSLLKTPNRNAYNDMDLMVARLHELGFTMVRYSSGLKEYTKGDGSETDVCDYLFYKMKQAGFRVWNTALSKAAGFATVNDVDCLKDPKTAKAWKLAIREMGGTLDAVRLTNNIARIWDPRLETIGIANMKRAAVRVNLYTGLSLADDPFCAVWELSNEDGFISRMTGGEWQKIPTFFQDELLTQWCVFLEKKYGSDANLTKAWGFLLKGESLANRSILLAPIRSSTIPVTISDANPEAVAMLQSTKQEYSRDDFTRARGSDVLEFFTKLWVNHKQREANAVKPLGKSLTQCALLWNTGFPGSSIQCQYLHEHADAVAHDSYIGGTHHDPTHKRFPFFSGLEELPRLAWKEPWLEQNRFPGKPFIVYETQIDNTSKYRAEFPMRLASLGSIQDWDIICWHYYGFAPDSKLTKPFEAKLDVGHSINLHFQFDEIQLSAMKAASEIFRNCLLLPAPNPTLFVFGKKALYDPASMDPDLSYGPGMLSRMAATSYRYGSRLIIDPTLEDRPKDTVFKEPGSYERFMEEGSLTTGPSYRPRTFEPNPIKPNNEIEYDWQKGYLMFDAPGVASYTGFLSQYGDKVVFRNGTTLKNVSIACPSDMPYPVTDSEKFLSFSLTSMSDAPLKECKRALVSLVSTSFNKGFKFDLNHVVEFFAPPLSNQGTLPVLVARVGATIENAACAGMKYRFVDWNGVELETGIMTNGVLTIPTSKPVFYVELTR